MAFVGVLALTGGGCASEDAPPTVRRSTETRQLGSWTGRGNTTLGFVSESGSFRVKWSSKSRPDQVEGRFLLTLRSGISGRPMRVIADQQGSGEGTVEFGDDPRLYEFLVEASSVEWAISVDEVYLGQK